jgi:hypothetical protein
MAETILVRSDLSQRLIDAGRSLIVGLDQIGLAYEAAFWLLDEESAIWHLVLSTKAVKMDGSRALYSQVHKVLLNLGLNGDIEITMISIVGDKTPIVKSLRDALGAAASVDGTRLDNAFLGAVRLPGCLLYRLSRRQKLQPMTSQVRK